jgi:soluble lytic murein transglycosylase-like protein
MSAKSAPQLVSPLNHARGTAIHARGTFLILALAMLMATAAWLIEPTEAQVSGEAVASQVEAPAAPELLAPIPAPAVEAAAPVAAENSRYRAISAFLAKRYKVSQTVTHDLVTIAYAAGHQMGVDPLLIIAVMAVESRFNPIAESVAGAKGLMQIIPRYHTDKFVEHGGVKAVFDPETNIHVGSRIIKEYISRTGDLTSALQLYAGAASDDQESYFGKVMIEKERLLQVLRRRGTAS